jgi:hypothetical protein
MAREDRAPSAWQIELCVAAWQRAQSAFAVDEELASDERPIVAALDADPNILPPDELLRRLVEGIAIAETCAERDKGFAQGMTARRKRYAARAMVLRSELLEVLQALERKDFTGSPYGTAKVKRGVASPLVLDEGQIPAEYFQTVRVLDKRKLWEDLRHGVVVDGAVLGNAMPVLALSFAKPSPQDDPEGGEC